MTDDSETAAVDGASGVEALNRHIQRVRATPADPGAWTALAECQLAMGDPAAAGQSLDRAFGLGLDYSDAYRVLCRVFMAMGQYAAAEIAAARAMELGADGPGLRFDHARSLEMQGKQEAAAQAYAQLLSRWPDDHGARLNLGNILTQLGQVEQAMVQYHLIVQADSRHAIAWMNYGNCLMDVGQLGEAEAAYEAAVTAAPDLGDAHWGLATCLLLRGDFSRGWREYGWRWQKVDAVGQRRWSSLPTWDGERLTAGRLLIHAEQGLGDVINFARLIPLAAKRAGPVVVECFTPLAAMLARLPGVERVIAPGDAVDGLQAAIALIDLPLILGIDREEAIPNTVPYVSAPETLTRAWHARLAPVQGLKVGLVWAGDPGFVGDRQRSPRLAPFAPLFDIPGIQVFALQQGDGRRDLEGWCPPANFTDLGPEISSFDDTAAIMLNLDLVVSSCTSPLHLAGALGCKTFAVLPFIPDWRWMMERRDTPWYPTMTLFRQNVRDDWGAVMAELVRSVAALAATKG